MVRSLNRFEFNLLRILDAFLGRTSLDGVYPLLRRKIAKPTCLSRDAVDLIKQRLAVSCPLILTREGGWHDERFLREDEIASGAVWLRTQPQRLGLQFSPLSLQFLVWVTAEDMTGDPSVWYPKKDDSFPSGDSLLLYLAFATVEETDIGDRWLSQPAFVENGMCGLMFADRFGQAQIVPKPDFSPWLRGAGAAAMECLQVKLGQRWVEMERGKRQIVTPREMGGLGSSQQAVLETFLEDVDRAGRRDLARFLLHVGQQLLTPTPVVDAWNESLDVRHLRLADRTQVYQSVSALLRQYSHLHGWQVDSTQVGYFDEGYAASQLWKSDWEKYNGDTIYAASQELIQQLQPL